MSRWLKKDPCLGLVTIPKRPLRSALGGTLRAILSASLGGRSTEARDVNVIQLPSISTLVDVILFLILAFGSVIHIIG